MAQVHQHRLKPDPDHIPHDMIGILALSVVGTAMVTGTVWLVFGWGAAIVVLAVVGMWLIARLSRRADRERVEEATQPRRKEKPIDPHDRQIS